MKPYLLGNFFGAKFEQIWTKVIKIWTNLTRFGQNQNLASSFRTPSSMERTFDVVAARTGNRMN